jgi:hypothetical protein
MPKWFMRWIKRIVVVGIVVVALPITAFIAFVIISNNRCADQITKSYQPFDAEKWLEADAKGTSAQQEYRVLAIEDLLAHKNFKGWTRAQVVSLLGQPTRTNKFQHYDIVYWLGPERSCIRIDSEWLVFALKEDQVKSYRVVAD